MTHKRALMPDYLRLFSLFGIGVVNVHFLAYSINTALLLPDTATIIDAIVLWLVDGLATMKTYGLFSFMFGVGLMFLMRSTNKNGLDFKRIYRNRMIGLLLLGIFHGCLFFNGDILALYAVTGSILYFMRNMSSRRLVVVGACLLALQGMLIALLSLLPGEIPQELLEYEKMTLTQGTLLDTIIFKSISFVLTWPILFVIQGISALGWFCLGLGAINSGMIDDTDHILWAHARRFCLIPGLIISLVGSALWHWWGMAIGQGMIILSAPIVTLGYLGLIAAIAHPPTPLMSKILAAGGSSLSIYLAQSIILSYIFAPFGVGLWENISITAATLLVIGVTILLIFAISLWRTWFKLGPFEWVLRKITYA